MSMVIIQPLIVKDIINVNVSIFSFLIHIFLSDFFQKHNVAVMTVRELFEFITDPSITSDNINQYLDKVIELH